MEDLPANLLGRNCKIQHSCSTISWQTCFSSLTSSRWKPSVSHPRNVAWKKSHTLCTSFILTNTQWVVNPSSSASISMSKTNSSPGFSHLLTWKNTLYEGPQQRLGKQSTASQIDSCLSQKHPDVVTKPGIDITPLLGRTGTYFIFKFIYSPIQCKKRLKKKH